MVYFAIANVVATASIEVVVLLSLL